MPVAELAAGLGFAGGSSLWNYNRENFFQDASLHQSRVYQQQSMQMARHGLFREDVRDSAGFTTNKQNTFLLVNTLLLSIIIGVFYNFDVADQGQSDTLSNLTLTQISVLYTATLFTSFFWLLSSMWFSLYAIITCDSLMTKLLLQVVRLPVPSTEEIMSAVPCASEFEGKLKTAFRVPFVQRKRQDTFINRNGREMSTASPPRTRKTSADLLRGHSTLSQAAHSARTLVEEDSSSFDQEAGPGEDRVWMQDIVDGTADLVRFANGKVLSKLEPHSKLVKLIRGNFTPFDFYANVTMAMGVSEFLSSLSYLSLSHFQLKGEFTPTATGWTAFAFTSVLTFWTLDLHLEFPIFEKVIFYSIVMVGPLTTLARHLPHIFDQYASVYHAGPHELGFIYFFHGLWITMLCWSAVFPWEKWPKRWRYKRFLNVLHSEEGPAPFFEDVNPYDEEDAAPGSGDVSSDSCSDIGAADSFTDRAVMEAVLSADALLASLRLLSLHFKPSDKTRASIMKARDILFEAARASCSLDAGLAVASSLCGFYVEEENGCQHWVDVVGSGFDARAKADAVPLEDLLHRAKRIAGTLDHMSYTWTVEDVKRLRAYGGTTVFGSRSFIDQFQQEGSAATDSIGLGAKRQFLGASIIITVIWGLLVAWSFSVYSLTPSAGAVTHTLENSFDAARAQFDLPQLPWFSPGNLGCNEDGTRFLIGDGAAVYLVNANGSELTGPLEACDEIEGRLAADFGREGSAWISCRSGLRSLTGTASAGNALGGLDALALDTVAPRRSVVDGLALKDDLLIALKANAEFNSWSPAGAVHSPSLQKGEHWHAIAYKESRGLALTNLGRVFEWDATTGLWKGSVRLPPGLQWKGICLLAGSEWLAMGQAPDTIGPVEIWKFFRMPDSISM